jgi:hypothetical protein
MFKRPDVSEYAAYYQPYIDRVPDGEVVATLRRQLEETTSFLRGVPRERQRSTYAPGKWTLNEVFGHVLDMEWVFTSRALMFARADGVTMPGADQHEFSRNARSTEQSLGALLEQFRCVRSAAVLLFDSFDESVWDRTGIASGNPFTVRSLAWIIAGHERHHRTVIAERYLVVPAP